MTKEQLLTEARDVLAAAESALTIPTIQAEVEAAAVKLKQFADEAVGKKFDVVGRRLDELATQCAMVVQEMVEAEQRRLRSGIPAPLTGHYLLAGLALQFLRDTGVFVEKWVKSQDD